MSRPRQRLAAADSVASTRAVPSPSVAGPSLVEPSMLAKVQAELADRYVEVEIEGLTLKRLGCIYVAAARQTKFRMLEGVRSFFHLNPAH